MTHFLYGLTFSMIVSFGADATQENKTNESGMGRRQSSSLDGFGRCYRDSSSMLDDHNSLCHPPREDKGDFPQQMRFFTTTLVTWHEAAATSCDEFVQSLFAGFSNYPHVRTYQCLFGLGQDARENAITQALKTRAFSLLGLLESFVKKQTTMLPFDPVAYYKGCEERE